MRENSLGSGGVRFLERANEVLIWCCAEWRRRSAWRRRQVAVRVPAGGARGVRRRRKGRCDRRHPPRHHERKRGSCSFSLLPRCLLSDRGSDGACVVMWLCFGMKDSKGKAKELSQWESDLRRRESVCVLALLFPWILAINLFMTWMLTEYSILCWNFRGSRISGEGRKLSRAVCFRILCKLNLSKWLSFMLSWNNEYGVLYYWLIVS